MCKIVLPKINKICGSGWVVGVGNLLRVLWRLVVEYEKQVFHDFLLRAISSFTHNFHFCRSIFSASFLVFYLNITLLSICSSFLSNYVPFLNLISSLQTILLLTYSTCLIFHFKTLITQQSTQSHPQISKLAKKLTSVRTVHQ